MARRFRRLRRAAHQVIEVTRNFWRLCHCCGRVRAETSRDVIPVSVVLSCTNLPRARTSFVPWNCCTRQDTRESDVVTQTSNPSFAGPRNWVRPTDSGLQPTQRNVDCGPSRQNDHCSYLPGAFSSKCTVTPSSRIFTRFALSREEQSANYEEFRASRFPASKYLRAQPILPVNGGSQIYHVPLRFPNEPQIHKNPIYRPETLLRNWGSARTVDAFGSPSGRLFTEMMGRDYRMNPSQAARHFTSRASTIFTGYASANNVTPSLASVEVPVETLSLRRTRFQRFDTNDKCLGFNPNPSQSRRTISPSLSSACNRFLPKPWQQISVVQSINISNPIDSLRLSSEKNICTPIHTVGGHSINLHPSSPCKEELLAIKPKSSRFIGQFKLDGSHNLLVSQIVCNNLQPIGGTSNNRLVSNVNSQNAIALRASQNDSSCAYALPGYSKHDPDLRLNLEFLRDSSSSSSITSLDLRVCFAVGPEWKEIDPENWHQRYTIARTKCGTVDVAYCDKFQKNFALKTLSPVSGHTEVEILRQCQGPFVAEMHAVLRQGDDKLLCTSYYERLDLAHWLRKDEGREHFTEREAALICSYILAGLEFIHEKGILHLDIKPGNVFLCSKGYPVLGDFGSARNVNNNTEKLRHFTPAYASPDVLAGEIPTAQADLWSTACVFYEIAAGRSPYHGKYAAVAELRILAGSTPDVSMLSIDCQHFICAQISSDKSERLGFSFGAREVMGHRLFHKINWDEVKYGHRHSDCPLAKVLRNLERYDGEPSQPSTSSVCNNNNVSRRELWSLTSTSDDLDENFWEAEDEESHYGRPERPHFYHTDENDVSFDDTGG